MLLLETNGEIHVSYKCGHSSQTFKPEVQLWLLQLSAHQNFIMHSIGCPYDQDDTRVDSFPPVVVRLQFSHMSLSACAMALEHALPSSVKFCHISPTLAQDKLYSIVMNQSWNQVSILVHMNL